MRRLLPLLLLLSVAIACGGTRERPSSPNPVNAPLCDTCIDLNWEEICFPELVTCEPGQDAECWDAHIACVEASALDEAQCWRTCKNTDQWPDAPFPDAADEVQCKGDCRANKLLCSKTSTAGHCSDARCFAGCEGA